MGESIKLLCKGKYKFLFLVVSLCLIAVQADTLDYPHTTVNNIGCGSCHYVWGSEPSLLKQGLSYGSNIDDTIYNALCWSCHNDVIADYMKTHSSLQLDDSYGNWTIECRTCHNPHSQRQIKAYGSDAYLTSGISTDVTTTTLTDTTKSWSSDEYAGLVLIPNVSQAQYGYKIESNTSDTITVESSHAYKYIDLTKVTKEVDTYAVIYGKLIKSTIDTSDIIDPGETKPGEMTVKFFNKTGTNSFADGPSPYDGVCEVCHTMTTHFQNDGGGSEQLHENLDSPPAGTDCTTCHGHTDGFMHGGGSGVGCDECHGHDPGYPGVTGGGGTYQTHSTHTEDGTESDDFTLDENKHEKKGPKLACSACHNTSSFPDFADGVSYSDYKSGAQMTTVCDTCHSPDGTYDGVSDAAVGAKNNWDNGVYETDGSLKSGKEKWCATCHDESPSQVSGVDAPNVIGDEDGSYTYGTGWGFYKTGHGLSSSVALPSSGGASMGAGKECLDCHESTVSHVDGEARTYSAGSDDEGDAYRAGYRLIQVDLGSGLVNPMRLPFPDIPLTKEKFALCASCHDPDPFLGNNSNTNLISGGINRHAYHLNQGNAMHGRFDSDWNGANESRVNCTLCHNVHGSKRLVMVRDGSLVNRNGFDIWYHNPDIVTNVSSNLDPPEPENLTLVQSTGIIMSEWSSTQMCSACHNRAYTTYYPRGSLYWDSDVPAVDWTFEEYYIDRGIHTDRIFNTTDTAHFRIKYFDPNNDAPTAIEVWIDHDDNGTYEEGEKTSMTEDDLGDTTYSDGKIYKASVSITNPGDKAITYRIYATDGTNEAVGQPALDNVIEWDDDFIREVPEEYTNIQDAVDEAYDGNDILVSDGTYNENVDYRGKDLIIRSVNGAAVTTIAGSGSDNAVVSFDNGEPSTAILDGFTINNVDTGTYYNMRGISISNGAEPQIKNNIITGNNHRGQGAGILIDGGAATITNCTIDSNITQYYTGGGVHIENGTATTTITNSSISSNTAKTSGGGLYVADSDITLTSVVIDNNQGQEGSGGGAYFSGSVNATISGGSISSNTAKYSGGGLNYSGDGTGSLSISDCTIDSNLNTTTSPSNGGGVYLSNVGSTTTITNTSISSNNAKTNGGGIYLDNAPVNLSGCTINNNAVYDVDGGGVWSNSSMTISDSDISNNTVNHSPDTGGGLYLSGASSVVNISDTTITGNTAPGSAGIHFAGLELNITGGSVSSNTGTAQLNGGGINAGSGTVTLAGVYVQGNRSGHGGGGVNAVTLTVTNSIITGNVCGGNYWAQGGGIKAGTIDMMNSTISGNTCQWGGGVWVSGGGTVVNSISWGNYTSRESKHNFKGDPTAATVSYTDTSGGGYTDGGNNISADPLFTDQRSYTESPTTAGDYHISVDTSPVVDTGTNTDAPSDDIDGNSRPQGTTADMGADEYLLSPDATTVGTATATDATTTSISVSMPYTGDDNNNNTYAVEYKLSSSGTWLDWGTNPKAHAASPYADTITGLAGGETYDVRLTYYDTDGINGSDVQTVSDITLGQAVSGTVYTDEGTTTIEDGTTVRLIVNGSSVSTDTTSSGAYSILASLDPGDAVLVYLDGAATDGTTVTVSDGSAMTGINIYGDRLITRHDNSGSLTSALMGTAKGAYSDDEILYSVSGGDLTVSGTGTELFVLGGHSFVPGGTITTAGIDINGTLNSEANAINVSGSWDATGGIFTSTGTVTFNAASGTNTITPGGTDADHDFQNIVFNDSAGTATFQLGGAIDVDNDFTVTDGVFDTNSASNYAVAVGGNFSQAADGQVEANASTITVTGNFRADGTIDSTDYNNASLVLTGGASNIYFTNLSDNWTNGINNLTVGASGTDILQNSLNIRNMLTIGPGGFGGATIFMGGSGDVFTFDASSTLSVSSVKFTGNSFNLPTIANGYDTNLILMSSNASVTQTGSVTLNSGKSLSINGDGNAGRPVTYNTDGYALTVGGDIILGAGSDTATKTFTATNSTVTVSGNLAINHSSNVFTSTGSTVVLNGTADQTVTSTGKSFNNLTLNNTGASGSDDIIIADALDINGTMTITDGDLDISTNNPTVNTAGAVTIASAGSVDVTSRTADWTFDGTSTLTDSSSGGPQDLEDVVLNGTSMILASNVKVQTLTNTAGTLDLGSSGYVLEIDGTGTPLSNSGTFTAGTSTVKYTGSGSATNITTLVYSSLQLTPTGATTYSMTGNLTGGNALTGNLTIDADATLDAVSGSNYNLTAVDATINGIYTPQGSTVTLSGNWDSNGTFTAGTSTVVLNGTDQQLYGSASFYNLTKSVTTARTLTFEAGQTTTIATGGTVTLNGASGQLLTMTSSTGSSAWNFNVASGATKAIDYVNVSWSDASGSDASQKPIEPTNSTNSGNNTEWFGANPPIGGYTADNVIPAAQVSQSTNGDGIITINWKAKDVEADNVTLKTFQYSVDDGNIWSAPTNGDASGALSTNWTDSDGGGTGYTSATTFGAATAHSFTFDTDHTDVTGMSGVDQSDVKIRFTLNDGAQDSNAPATSESLQVDNLSPTVTITSANYDSGSDTMTITGTNMTTIAAASTDIKSYLDWSKFVWDINIDDATTADITFSVGDVTSLTVTNSTTLTMVVTSAKGTAIEATTGYGNSGGTDALDITAGFSIDAVGNVSTTDGASNAAISTGTSYAVSKTTDTNDGTCDADCSLREAIEAANSDSDTSDITLPSGTYTLTISGNDDTNAAGDLDIIYPVNIYGAGSGSTVIRAGVDTATAIDRIFHVTNASALTIEAVKLQYAKVTGTGGCVNSSGVVTIKSSILDGCNAALNNGGAVYTSASVAIDNSSFSNGNAGSNGGAIYTNGLTITNGATFTNNYSANKGGAIYNAGTSNTITGSGTITFTNNDTAKSTDDWGGAIYSDGDITLTGSSNFTNNDALTGGAIFLGDSGATVSLENTTFESNTCTNSGGALYTYGLTITGGATFTDNYAGGKGGAVYSIGSNAVTVSGTSTWTNNDTAKSTDDWGGAIYSEGNVTFNDASTFTNNDALAGGAIIVYNAASTLSMVNPTFSSNTATNDGGAVWTYGMTITGGASFSDNYVGGKGGGIYSKGTNPVEVTGTSTWTNNDTAKSTSDWGGAIYAEGNVTFNSASTFTNNDALSGGAIIVYNSASTLSMVNPTFNSNTATNDGGAVWTYGMTITSGASFTDNYVGGKGAAICSLTGDVSIDGTATFTNNDSQRNNDTDDGGAIWSSGNFIHTNGTITFENNDAWDGGAVYLDTGKTFTAVAATFTGNTANGSGGAIVSRGLTITGGATFQNNNAPNNDGGAIYNTTNALNINGTILFDNNDAGTGLDDWGGAIYSSADVTLNDVSGASTFQNSEAYSGGAVYVNTGAALTLTDATFTGNTASNVGGAIRAYGMTITGGATFQNNSATNDGGAIYNSESVMSINGDTLFDNNDTSLALDDDGGAIYSTQNVTLNDVEGSTTFQNNDAYNGGAIRIQHSTQTKTLTMTGPTFTSNTAQNAGGAVIAEGIVITGGATFTTNGAENDGGAIYNTEGSLSINGTTLFDNNDVGTGSPRVPATGDVGGAIYSAQPITLNDVTGGTTFQNCGANEGGAIYMVAAGDTISMTNATFTGNSATGIGGAIRSYGLTITDSTFTNNDVSGNGGGAVYNTDAAISISGTSSFTNNDSTNGAATKGGGAIFTTQPTTITGTATFDTNTSATSGGAIYGDASGDTVTITGATFKNNTAATDGGAIRAYGGSITTSTFNNNTATNGNGGAINNPGTTLTFANSTISGNTATNGAGGGLYNGSTCTITNSTFYNNSAGTSPDSIQATSCTIKNSIIYNGTSSNENCSTTFSTNNYNYENGDATNDCGFTGANDINTSDPLLNALADNGGSTWTHKPQGNSFVIDTADNTVCAASPINNVDQIGTTRPVNGTCDMGSFEYVAGSNAAPVGGYTVDNVIPSAQVTESGSGDGIITINWKGRDNETNNVTLKLFEYSVDDGATWAYPANGDSSAAFSANWTNNGGSGYTTATTFGSATVHSFTFDTDHDDVDGMEGIDQSDVKIRFLLYDGTSNSATHLTSEAFRVNNPAATFTVTKTADTRDGTCDADCSIREAIDAANVDPDVNTVSIPSGTYTITLSGNDDTNATGDFDITQPVNIVGAGSSLTIIRTGIDLANATNRIFHDTISGAVTIEAVKVQYGKITGTGGCILTAGNLTVKDSIVDSCTATSNDGGAIYTAASVTIDNSTISNASAGSNGGAIYTNGMTITNGATFTNNYSTNKGGAIYNAGTSNTITGSGTITFTNNDTQKSTTDWGGAIYSDGSINLSGSSTFSNNDALAGGAIIVYNSAATITLNDTEFTSNTANGNGGAIWTYGLTITGGATFTDNYAVNKGGAIYSNGTEPVEISGISSFTNNDTQKSTDDWGGAIYSKNDVIINDQSMFTNNDALTGGAIFIDSTTATVTLVNPTFDTNTATNSGGAIYTNGLTITGGATFQNNYTGSKGGAVYSKGTNPVEVTGTSTWTNNDTAKSTDDWGGAIYAEGNVTFNSASTFENNDALAGGAIIVYNSASTLSMVNPTFTTNTVTGNGGAVNTYGMAVTGGMSCTGNYAGNSGGCIYNKTGDFTIDGTAAFTNNDSQRNANTDDGGAIWSSGDFTHTNGTITFENNDAYDGGAVYMDTGKTFTAVAATFTGNSSTGNGGAIYSRGLTVTGGATFQNNYSTGNDGGAICNTTNPVNINGTILFDNNDAGTGSGDWGGAIYSSADVTLNDVSGSATFQNSEAYEGGAIFMDSGTTLTLTSATFNANYAVNVGGALRMYGGTLTDVTFTGNYVTNDGGAIINTTGALTINGTSNTFTGNYAGTASGDVGGTIYTSGSLTISNASFTGRNDGTADAYEGGAIQLYDTSDVLTVSDTSFDSFYAVNVGGALRMYGGTLTDVTFTDNYVTNDGGAIINTTGSLIINGSSNTFTGNYAGTASGDVGGTIYTSGSLTISNASFIGRNDGTADAYEGGAIRMYDATDVLTITDASFDSFKAGNVGGAIRSYGGTISGSTFSNNTVAGAGNDGGALYNSGTLNVYNSTFSANSVTDKGGAIFQGGNSTIKNSTFYNNSAGTGEAIYENSGAVTVANTIVAKSTASSSLCYNVGSNDYNLQYNGTCFTAQANDRSGDPLLASLADNGGQTKTHALTAGSDAIDNALGSVCTDTDVGSVDQRGETRTSTCDIGAYEDIP